MARLPPSRHTLHCRLRFLDRRAGRPSPLRTTFCCTALAICHSRRLPTQRRRRSDPSATSQTRSRPCDDASSSLSPRPSRDALVATPRSARHYEFPITDAVRLTRLRKSQVVQKKTAALIRGGCRGPRRPPGFAVETTTLGEDDLDAAVLRLAHAVRRRDAQVVLATAGDHH